MISLGCCGAKKKILLRALETKALPENLAWNYIFS